MCRARRHVHATFVAMRDANPGTTPCKHACCSTDREHVAHAHDRYDMRGRYVATGDARGPIRFPVCFDVVACRRRVRRSREIRLRQRHRVNRKARAMRRKSKREKRVRVARAATRGAMVGKCFRNVSVSGAPSRKTRLTELRVDRAAPAERGRTAVSARASPRRSIVCRGIRRKSVAKV